MAASKVELDPDELVVYVPPLIKSRNFGFVFAQEITQLFDFTNMALDNEEVSREIAAFLIDMFITTKNAFFFFSLCQHVAREQVEWHVFLNAVRADRESVNEVKVTKISTREELQSAYQTHLPNLGTRSSLKCEDEAWQFVSLGVICLKFPDSQNLKQFEIFMKKQLQNLSIKHGSVANLLKKDLADKISWIARSPAYSPHTRSIIVKWALDNQATYFNYLPKVCNVLKGSHMTHILLIKQFVWDNQHKREKLMDLCSRNNVALAPLSDELKRFERVVVPHFGYKYFEYMRLVQSKNIFEAASRQCLPILTNAAVTLGLPSNPALEKYVRPQLPRLEISFMVDVVVAFSATTT